MNSPMKNDILYDTFIAASQYFHNNKNRRNEIAPNNVKYILFLLLLWSVFLSGASILVIFSLWPTSSEVIRDRNVLSDWFGPSADKKECKESLCCIKNQDLLSTIFNKEMHISNIFMIPCRLYIQSHFLFFFFLGSYAVWQMEPRHKISNYKWVVLQLLLCMLWISLHYRYKQRPYADESKCKLSARSLIFNNKKSFE